MLITEEMKQAAAEALGWEVPDYEIKSAIAEHGNCTAADLQKHVEMFNTQGGRGVELADKIDAMRIALAVLR